MTDLRYPVGEFARPTKPLATAERAKMIDQIQQAPSNFRAAVKGLSEKQLDTPYRPGGWTVRQVVHHVADSHMNAYIRLKLTLTEENPPVKPYDEAKWAELVDGRTAPVEQSLAIIEMLHARWVMVLRSMSSSDFARVMSHPEWGGPRPVDYLLAMYSWHGRHHCAHITELRKREGWT